MATLFLITPLLVFLCLLGSALGGVFLSTLPRTLEVQAAIEHGAIFQAGIDKLTVKWGLNRTFLGETDDKYKMVKFKLCFAPISQHDRPWRKSNDDISMDKSCKIDIVCRPYSKNEIEDTFNWLIGSNVPTATYFIRAYALNSTDKEVGYGQTTDDHKTVNLFKIIGISGRSPAFNIVAACFSALTLVSVCGFFMFEKRKNRRAAENRE